MLAQSCSAAEDMPRPLQSLGIGRVMERHNLRETRRGDPDDTSRLCGPLRDGETCSRGPQKWSHRMRRIRTIETGRLLHSVARGEVVDEGETGGTKGVFFSLRADYKRDSYCLGIMTTRIHRNHIQYG